METVRTIGVEEPITADVNRAALEAKMQSVDYVSHELIEVLIAAQDIYGYLSESVMTYIARKLRVPPSQVWSVATFYDRFTIKIDVETECLICTGPVCSSAGAKEILAETCKQSNVSKPGKASSDGKFLIKEASCLGLCDHAPAALVNQKAQVNLSLEDIPAMLRGEAGEPVIQVTGRPRVLTAPINKIPPTDLSAHLAEGAFSALRKALFEITPEEVIEELRESRLAGRGGANFLAGLKWQLARRAEGNPKYVVCNFDESEPGTFKDRVLIEGNPFRVLEGLIICGYTIGAKTGYIFIRNEYHQAARIVEEAVDRMYTANLLGDRILGSAFDFDLKIIHNAGAYICGEESALFEAIEGKHGYPRHKPPYPTQTGLFGKPTVVNNVETLAVVPDLVNHGGEWFLQWGTHQSVGLKLFCFCGHVQKPCVVESPYGIPLREMVEEFCGGFMGKPQAILIGGAVGGFLHPNSLDIPLTHEDLRSLDIPLGTGSVMVFNQSVNMWQTLEDLARFFMDETCGQCAPCRLGTREIHEILTEINHGKGTFADIHKLDRLGQMMKEACLCGLGQSVATPFRTFLENIETIS
ncbi:MAG: NAD(P)H-dependent oxidoreductase subunit E [Anaerolineales bacterium]|nr:NAD(P)H-dependent oxidoreductase subunit E [Anaerolineales bacterium]